MTRRPAVSSARDHLMAVQVWPLPAFPELDVGRLQSWIRFQPPGVGALPSGIRCRGREAQDGAQHAEAQHREGRSRARRRGRRGSARR
jgi:hypothetical protein